MSGRNSSKTEKKAMEKLKRKQEAQFWFLNLPRHSYVALDKSLRV